MLMDNTLELLGITDSNIKITRFSAESVNGEKRNVIAMWTDAPTANLKMPDKFSRNPTAFVRLFIETGLFPGRFLIICSHRPRFRSDSNQGRECRLIPSCLQNRNVQPVLR